MKKIEAIVKSSKMRAVRDALGEIGLVGMTVTKVNGSGNKKATPQSYRGASFIPAFVPMAKIDIVVGDDEASRVIETITQSAKTGKVGDGKIFVYDISKAVRIRTGETGKNAI